MYETKDHQFTNSLIDVPTLIRSTVGAVIPKFDLVVEGVVLYSTSIEMMK